MLFLYYVWNIIYKLLQCIIGYFSLKWNILKSHFCGSFTHHIIDFFIGRFCLLILSLRSWFLLKIELSSQPLHWLAELVMEVPTSPSVDNILPQSTSKSFCCLVQSLLACRTGIIIVRSCFSGEQKEELSEGLETSTTGEGPSLASRLPCACLLRTNSACSSG